MGRLALCRRLFNAAQEHPWDRARVYCIFDRDYHSDAEIHKRLADSEQRGIELHVWAKKELENYLLNPVVLHRLILGLNPSKPLSQEMVEVRLSEIADELKQVVIDGRMDAFLFEDKKLQPSTAAKRAREWVDNRWCSLSDKLNLIPGKEAISRFAGWAQEKLKVSFGSATVWRAFTKRDVPVEMVKVLEAIELNAEL